MRKRKVMAASIAAVALLAGGGLSTTAAADGGGFDNTWGSGAKGQGEAGYSLQASGAFAPPAESDLLEAVTYDEELVPAGAQIMVSQRVTEDIDTGMVIEVEIEGVHPGHTFGVHAHTGSCGVDPTAAGGHYQHEAGEDPSLANPSNEVWLDFTADDMGGGEAQSQQDWVFRAGEANSVVLHEHATDTGEDGGTPGDAGSRVACFSVPLLGFGGT